MTEDYDVIWSGTLETAAIKAQQRQPVKLARVDAHDLEAYERRVLAVLSETPQSYSALRDRVRMCGTRMRSTLRRLTLAGVLDTEERKPVSHAPGRGTIYYRIRREEAA